jgi:methylated-DNA-protein-cysteine methyltransferase related protein
MGRRPAVLDPGPRLSGTHTRILAVVRKIPRGRVASYGQVAELAGLGGQARLAGYALHALPEGTPLPWHRVLGAGGRLSIMKLDPAAGTTQRLRLEREGVRFDARGRVDMDRWRWRPRAARASRGTGAPRGSASRVRRRRRPLALDRRPRALEKPR